jgi:schlafen family protein
LFSPFDKPLESLAAADLDRLRGVAEGWYVEYKSEVSKAPDVAKSVSALANTYGGWVFYGVEEKSKAEPVAGSFPGIEVGDADAALQRIRQAVAQHMNPAAHFDARAVAGDGVTFASDRVVICVRVPQSLAAPHVHSSGRIYRRVADGSEPKPENDRHLLDQLFRRSDDLRKQFAEWVDRDPELSRDEEEAPYLRLMTIADPWGDESPWLETNTAELKPLFAERPGLVSSVPFDVIYTSSRGYVARQEGNDPHNLGLTWRFRESLVSDVYVPLNLYAVNAPYALHDDLDGYEQADRFVELLEAKAYSSPRVVDLNLLFNVLVGVVEIQQRLLAKANWTKSYFVKARLLNVWRTVPFLDVDAVMDRFEADGLPVCLDGLVTAPSGTDPETFQEVEPILGAQSEAARVLLQALVILEPIARAWGLPIVIEREMDPPMYERLQAAGVRGLEVQKRKAAGRGEGGARF